MKTRRLVSIGLLAIAISAQHAFAAVIDPTANFTLRANSNAGPVLDMDNLWDGNGFNGFLTNAEGNHQVDRTYFEFDLTAIAGPVSRATLNFSLDGFACFEDLVSLGWYSANGTAEFADWFMTQTPVTTFIAATNAYAIDITALVNSNLGNLAFIGFGFTIDPHPQQAFFDQSVPAHINIEPVPEPNTYAMLLAGLTLLGTVCHMRRLRDRAAHS